MPKEGVSEAVERPKGHSTTYETPSYAAPTEKQSNVRAATGFEN